MSEVRIDPLSGQRVIVGADATSVDPASVLGADATSFEPASALGADATSFEPASGLGADAASFEPASALGADTTADPAPAVGGTDPPVGPILDRDSPQPEPSAYPDLFWAGPASGSDELIDNGPTGFDALTTDEAVLAVDRWRERMRAHAGAACLHLYCDERPAAASRARLLAMDFVPALIARERERFRGYATRTMGGNLLGDLLQQEVRFRERIVAIDAEAVLLSAYAARVPYQLMLVPRAVRMRFEDDGPTGAALLHAGLGRLRTLLGAMPPVSLWVRTAPQGAEQFCWRIDVVPRLAGWDLGGLELGAGLAFNPLSPEAAAARLRDAA